MKDDYYLNSMCQEGYLHRFNLVKEYEHGVLEVCEICALEKFFPVVNGKTDNAEYMSWHVRQALHPHNPLFFHEYQYQPLNDNIPSPYVK